LPCSGSVGRACSPDVGGVAHSRREDGVQVK
jgi:hypothetical protein